MPFCPQCGVDNPEGARFCDQCGAMLIPVAGTAAPAPSPAATPAPSVSTVTCPQCGTAALPGEAFCENCGAPLSAPARPVAPVPTPPYSSNIPPQPSYPPPQPAASAPPSYQPPPTAPITPPPVAPPAYQPPPSSAGYRAGLAPSKLTIVDTGATIALPNAVQAVIGRADPVSQFFPDIDLTPHGALDNGVGRRHARIFVSGGQVMVEDLDSTNGTTHNGRRLAVRQPQPLRDGDQVVFGRLNMRYSEY